MSTMLEQTQTTTRPVSAADPPRFATGVAEPCAPDPAARRSLRLTHMGLVRAMTRIAIWHARTSGLYAVADGMGGPRPGMSASQMAISHRARGDRQGSGALQPAHAGPHLLIGGVELANALIIETAAGDPTKRGMGTTFTGMLLFGNRIPSLAHVGDSRAYLLRNRRFEQVTEDHTWVRAMVEAGP